MDTDTISDTHGAPHKYTVGYVLRNEGSIYNVIYTYSASLSLRISLNPFVRSRCWQKSIYTTLHTYALRRVLVLRLRQWGNGISGPSGLSHGIVIRTTFHTVDARGYSWCCSMYQVHQVSSHFELELMCAYMSEQRLLWDGEWGRRTMVPIETGREYLLEKA